MAEEIDPVIAALRRDVDEYNRRLAEQGPIAVPFDYSVNVMREAAPAILDARPKRKTLWERLRNLLPKRAATGG